MSTFALADVAQIAARGEEIYNRKYRQSFEVLYPVGKWVAIDVNSEEAHVGDTAEEAVELALKAAPNGISHLLRVGMAAAYHHHTPKL